MSRRIGRLQRGLLAACAVLLWMLALALLPSAVASASPAVTVGSSPLGITIDSATGRAYVTNAGSNTVSVINTSQESVVATIPVGSVPVGVGVDPSTNT